MKRADGNASDTLIYIGGFGTARRRRRSAPNPEHDARITGVAINNIVPMRRRNRRGRAGAGLNMRASIARPTGVPQVGLRTGTAARRTVVRST